MAKKLILPAEVKVCATCSYWDGERQVDEELGLVVVSDESRGVCLVHEDQCNGLLDVRTIPDCAWEPLAAEIADDAEDPVGDSVTDEVVQVRTGT